MATIERTTLENRELGGDPWDAIARRATAWAAEQGVPLRDAVVLLPFAQLLPLARRAFAAAGGWQPRVETTQSLATSLGPAAPAQAGQIRFDAAVDTLAAAALLQSQPWGAVWSRRDARGFAQAAAAVTAAAHALARAAFERAPGAREAFWAQARGSLAPIAGPGATERLLARLAVEWACLAPEPSSDRLFGLPAATSWIVVRAGGSDPLVESLLAASTSACLELDTDPTDADPFAALVPGCAPTLALCDDFEHEAQRAAAQVIEHLRRGEVPVALIAQDRVLVRRVRALLERHRVVLLDETGWKLSTTRAAARLMTLLAAARPEAGTDALLDWLKSGTRWAQSEALADLERICRRGQIARVAALAQMTLPAAAARLWAAAAALLAPLGVTRRQPLGQWLGDVLTALDGCGALTLLEADDAGRQVLAQLRRAGPASEVAMDAEAFQTWIDGVLEQASFVPAAERDAAPQVVITPLPRAMLRPFAALVMPGADDRHLGAPSSADALLGDALAGALGLPTLEQRRSRETLAFVQALATPRLTLLRRRIDGGEPLAASPLVERLALALAARGGALCDWVDPRIALAVTPTPIRMSAPAAPRLLPARLSASACEALRACPYRFFALNMLRLREDDELERELEKRDYGSWLHGVLYAFHATRAAPAAAALEVERLLQTAEAQRLADGLPAADFLPFEASFASFAPRYIDWLHARDAEGARWREGELAITAAPDGLGGTEMHGRIDRVDAWGGGALQVIDYKTGGAAGLKDKVREPLEDTQLAFYAALMRTQSAAPLRATYLAVDGTRSIDAVEHPDVEDSAAALLAGLAHDLQRLRAGAGLPALGEGATCDHCAARGVCRRDHWALA